MLAVGSQIVLLGAWAYKTAVNSSWGQALLKSYYTLNSVPGGGTGWYLRTAGHIRVGAHIRMLQVPY